jgi:hypothetical protein
MRDDLGMAEMPWWQQLFGVSVSRRDPVTSLKLLTDLVESTDRPEHEQAEAEKAYEKRAGGLGSDATLTKMFAPAVGKVGQACRRKSAQVRCLMALVAVERYRLNHGNWPASLEVVEFLDAIPLDPFDGKPLRYKRLIDGVVVYSVGVDGVDDGGNLDRSRPTSPGVDLGYRLWDEAARRQPPKAAAPAP